MNKNKNTVAMLFTTFFLFSTSLVHTSEQLSQPSSQQKVFACSICPKSYKRKQCLVRHVKTVHNSNDTPKPYLIPNSNRIRTCTTCNKSFTTQFSLKRHLKIHKGIYPFKCSFCNKAFRRKDHLKRHNKECKKPLSLNTPSLIPTLSHPNQPAHSPTPQQIISLPSPLPITMATLTPYTPQSTPSHPLLAQPSSITMATLVSRPPQATPSHPLLAQPSSIAMAILVSHSLQVAPSNLLLLQSTPFTILNYLPPLMTMRPH